MFVLVDWIDMYEIW